ncbi:hypothetical protein cypCar_00019423 [Cyprinus carpio]|nr:hypothetical protein cypCar_00019423 [Cyprinus carpio]
MEVELEGKRSLTEPEGWSDKAKPEEWSPEAADGRQLTKAEPGGRRSPVELKEIKVITVKCQKLIQERERGQREISEAVKSFKVQQHRRWEKTIEGLSSELICSLLERNALELKSRSEIQSCQSVCVLPSYKDVPSFTQHTHLSFKDISISAFREVLEDVCQQQTDRISREVSNVHVAQTPEPNTPDFCQLELDPNTANKELKLSEENRKASYSYEVQQYPDHPERFDGSHYIMCREGLCGRCYWEVECSGNNWAVAVCYKRIGRKRKSDVCILGYNKISWRLGYFLQNFCFLHDKAQVRIPAASRIGVYLDHRAGTLCFYSVFDTMTLLHRVQTTFTEPLYPAFLAGMDSSVRIIEQKRAHKDQK